MVIGVSGLLGVICVVIGFALGENKVISERSLSTVLTRDLASANAQIQELEKRLIDAELNASVQRSAGNQVRDDMTGLLGRVETLRAEVTFYKSLMAPSDLTARVGSNPAGCLRHTRDTRPSARTASSHGP